MFQNIIKNKKILKTIKILFAVLILITASSFFVSNTQAWTPPTTPPPGDNVDKPLNVGTEAQSKEGWLGIGITGEPSTALEVGGQFTSNSGYIVNGLEISTGDLNVSTGSIGIGTATPMYDLDVLGNINFTGNLYEDGSEFQTGYWEISGSDIYYNSGKVGIGTTNPVNPLQVSGTGGQYSALPDGFHMGTDGLGNAHLELVTSGGTPYIDFLNDNSNDRDARIRLAGNGDLRIEDTSKFIIDSGNVGIGIGSPQNKLDVSGSLAVGAGYAGNYVADSNGMIVEGSVGIGTVSPQTKLDVGKGDRDNAGAPNTTWNIISHVASPAYDGDAANKQYVDSVVGSGDNDWSYDPEIDPTKVWVGTATSVGIGTDTPTKALDVEGDINFTGTLYQNDSEFQTGYWSQSGSDIYYNDGSVGIGTTSPSQKLHVVSDTDLNAQFDTTGINKASTVSLSNPTNAWSFGIPQLGGTFRIRDITAGRNIFQIEPGAPVDSWRMDSDGHVGIGTTEPYSKLFVANGELMVDHGTGGTTDGAAFRFFSNAGHTYWSSNNYYDGSSKKARDGGSGMIRMDIGTDATAGDIDFYTSANATADSSTNFQQRMIIKQDGNVGIGTNSPQANLHVDNGLVSVEDTANPGTYQTPTEDYYLAPVGYVDSQISSQDQYIGSTSPDPHEAGASLDMNANDLYGDNFSIPNSGDTYFNSGNVGIGTTDPAGKLEINSTSSPTIRLTDDSGAYLDINGGVQGVNSPYIDANIWSTLSFKVSGTETMTLKDTGNVGVGYSDPGTAKLAIDGNVGIGTTEPSQKLSIELSDSGTSLSNSNMVNIYNNDNTSGNIAGIWFGQAGTNLSIHGAGLLGVHTDHTAGTRDTDLSIYTSENNTASEKVRITNAGNVGIGTTSPATRLHLAGSGSLNGIKFGDADTGNVGLYKIDNWTLETSNHFVINNSQYLGMRNSGGSVINAFYMDGSNNLSIDKNSSTNSVKIQGSSLVVDSTSGNVGIGTTDPQANLHVDNGLVSVEDTANPGTYQTPTEDYYLAPIGYVNETVAAGDEDWAAVGGGNATLTGDIYHSGNVGIGSTDPQGMLDVNNNLVVTDTQITMNVPLNLAAAGDISVSSDLQFTDATSSSIRSQAPLSIIAGDFGTNANLTLIGRGAGEVVVEDNMYVSGSTDMQSSLSVADSLSVGTSNFNVDSTGLVGIGTDNPQYALDIYGGDIKINDFSGGDDKFAATIGYVQSIVEPGGGGGLPAGLAEGQTLRWDHAGEAWQASGELINTGTNVGIGTTNPGALLQIGDNSGTPALKVFGYTSDSSPMTQFVTNAGEVGRSLLRVASDMENTPTYALEVLDTGNVGIGSTSPQEKLDVSGGVRADRYFSNLTGDGWLIKQDKSGASENRGLYYYDDTSWDFFNAGGSVLSISSGGSLQADGELTVLGSGDSYIQGNIGIGSTSPQEKLDIDGNAIIDTVYDRDTYDYYLDLAANEYSYGLRTAGSIYSEGTAVDNYFAGNVGIGTTSPLTKLHLDNDGAILAQGTYGSGWTESDLGAGTRLLWYPRKAAFRAGGVDATQWDDSNIGSNSFAVGQDTTASGSIGATALGYETTASGHQGATALGESTTASGSDGAIALGYQTTASGSQGATALGQETTASGDNGATALGFQTTAGGSHGTTALGFQTTASGAGGATALGDTTTASGIRGATALGRGIEASGDSSVAIGLNDQSGTVVSQDNTMAIMGGNVGIGTISPQTDLHVDNGLVSVEDTSVPGTYQTPTEDYHLAPVGYVNDTVAAGDEDWAAVGGGDPTLAGDIYHTGSVGIGTTSPNTGLHIYEDYDATYDEHNAVYVNQDTSYGGSNSKLTRAGYFKSKSISSSHTKNIGVLGEAIKLGGYGNWARGVMGHAQHQYSSYSGFEADLYGVYSLVDFEDDGVAVTGAGEMYNFYGAGDIPASKTIDDYYGLYLASPIVNGTITNNRFGVYQEDGVAENYFAGNVGIGTTDPGAKLEVADSTSGAAKILINSQNIGYGTATLEFNADYDGSGLDYMSKIVGTYDSGAAQGRGEMAFSTAVDGSYAEAMRITHDGNVGIGTTDPLVELDVSGDIISSRPSTFSAAETTKAYLEARVPIPSVKTAGELGIGVTDENDINDNLAGERDANIACTSGVNYATAKSTVEGIGARLPTLEEAEGGVAEGTGCQFDVYYVWTQTKCGQSGVGTGVVNYYWITAGDPDSFNSLGRYCVAETETTPPAGHSSSYNEIGVEYVAEVSKATLPVGYDSSGNVDLGSADLDTTGTITATSFVGDGSGLTNIDASAVNYWNKSGTDLYYNDGNVGIGTTDPAGLLHINDADVNNKIRFQKSTEEWLDFNNGTLADIQLNFVVDSSKHFSLGVDDTDDFFKISRAATLDTNTYFTIDTGGNVGIGATNPDSLLHLNKPNGNVGIKIEESSESAWLIGRDDSENNFVITEGSNENNMSSAGTFVIEEITGNVGIGTDSPQADLHIDNGLVSVEDTSVPGTYQTPTEDYHLAPVGYVNDQISAQDQYIGSTSPDPHVAGASLDMNANDLYGDNFSIPNSGDTYFNSGNVGIGTTDPGTKLEIQDSSLSGDFDENLFRVRGMSGYSAGTLALQRVGGLSSFDMRGFDDRARIELTRQEALSDAEGRINFKTAASNGGNLTTRMTILGTGNVGIGTTSPQDALHVAGETRIDPLAACAGVVKADSDGRLYCGSATAADADWAWTSGSGLTDPIYHTGNVGIGTTDPGVKLHVDGSSYFDTDTGNQSVYISRQGLTNESLELYTHDRRVTFHSIQDENSGQSGGFQFDLGGYDNIADSFIISQQSNLSQTSPSNVLFSVRSTGNVGIGTTDPGAKLHVDGNAIIDTIYDEDNGSYFLDPAANIFTYGLYTAGSIYSEGTADNYFAGNVGIGTNSPDTLLTLSNDSWISAKNSAGTGHVNMFKVNTSNEIEVGSTLNIGTLGLAEDSGALTLVNMPVSSAPTAGTPEMYSFSLDSEPILNIYSEADGTGGIQNKRVGIGTTDPDTTFHVEGDGVKLDIQDTIVTDMVLTAANNEGQAYWTDISDISGTTGTGAGSSAGGQATFWTGTSTISGDNDFYWDNTDKRLGIGTTDPQFKLSTAAGNTIGTSIVRFATDSYLNTAEYGFEIYGFNNSSNGHDLRFRGRTSATGLFSDLMTIENSGNVGIGTTDPDRAVDISGDFNTDGLLVQKSTDSSRAELFMFSSGSSLNLYNDEGESGVRLRSYGDSYFGVSSDGGNVGIGTTSPDNKLHIDGGDLKISNPGAGNIALNDYTNTHDWIIDNGYPSIGLFNIRHNGSNKFTIQPDGNVGIGTTNPGTDLHIDSSNNVGLELEHSSRPTMNFSDGSNDAFIGLDGGGDIITTAADNDLAIRAVNGQSIVFGEGGTERMRVSGDGNVGIGTTNPTTRLFVGDLSTGGDEYISIDKHGVANSGIKWDRGGTIDGEIMMDADEDLHIINHYGDKIILNDGSGVLALDGSGNVGIGTTDPDTKLHIDVNSSEVYSPTDYSQLGHPSTGVKIYNENASANYSGLELHTRSGGYSSMWQMANVWQEDYHGDLVFKTRGPTTYNDAHEVMRLQNNGNVGIGTTDPSANRLVIDGGGLTFQGAGSHYVTGLTPLGEGDPDTHAANKGYVDAAIEGGITGVGLWASGTGDNIYKKTTTGNVGIGTTDPQKELDVVGDATIDTIYDQDNASYFLDPGANVFSYGLYTAGSIHSEGTADNYFAGNVGIGTSNPQGLLDVNDNLVVTDTQITMNVPLNLAAAGDISIASDLVFTDSTSSSIRSQAPLSIIAGDFGTNTDLTLKGRGSGEVVVDDSLYTTSDASLASATMRGDLNLGDNNINGVTKLEVLTIDPVFEIDGEKYATYVADFSGGVRTETAGMFNLNKKSGSNVYKHTINFENLEKGSDLWLFWETVEQDINKVIVLLTPNFNGDVWYKKIDDSKIAIYGRPKFGNQDNLEVSYRLNSPRHDAKDWPNMVKHQKGYSEDK